MCRRESRLGFLLLILIIGMAGANASAWRIGMICITDERIVDVSFADRLNTLFASQFPYKNLSTNEVQTLTVRLASITQLEDEKNTHEVIKKNDGALPLKEVTRAEPLVIPSQIETLWVIPSIPMGISQAVIEQDVVVINHLIQLHDLDQLLVAHATAFEGFTRLQLNNYHLKSPNGRAQVLFDRIALPQETENLLNQAVVAIAPAFYGGQVGAVGFSSTIPDIKISIDGVEADSQQGFFFLIPGKHLVKAEALGYVAFETWITVLAEDITFVKLPLKRMDSGPLLWVSPQGTSSLWIQPDLHVSVPFLWPHPEFLFTYQANKEGFLPIFGQVHAQQTVLTLDFVPEWMSQRITLNRSRDSFYRSLGRTLLAFGLTVCAESISKATINPAGQDAWSPVVLAGAGTVGVSLFDTIFRLFAYYRKTQYISQ